MFTGIVQAVGRIAAAEKRGDGLRIALDIGVRDVADVAVGDSIAVNGCCLTVVAESGAGFVADVMPETARRTNLGALQAGDAVNLEAALRMGDRIGGHMVTGHIDAVGLVAACAREANAVLVRVEAPVEVLRYVVEKGCVAVDGISLTVVSVDAASFTVSLIPHTMAVTVAGRWAPGSTVNLEADMVAKYVERGLTPYAGLAGRQE